MVKLEKGVFHLFPGMRPIGLNAGQGKSESEQGRADRLSHVWICTPIHSGARNGQSHLHLAQLPEATS